jgi:hypothetical protein
MFDFGFSIRQMKRPIKPDPRICEVAKINTASMGARLRNDGLRRKEKEDTDKN